MDPSNGSPHTSITDYFVIPTAPPVEYTCIVCTADLYTDLHTLPCGCLVPIHVGCIDEWKRTASTCTVCQKQWIQPERASNVRWAIYCIFILIFAGTICWMYYNFLWRNK